ncbi:hypothetical protein EMGBS15_10880 [Filimonas sp.]|nr:hypothetical protein EMGBS15_10880 [Filimonas sp.]
MLDDFKIKFRLSFTHVRTLPSYIDIQHHHRNTFNLALRE